MIPAFASPSPSSSSTSSSPSRNARARTTRHERVHSDRARPTLTTRARIHSLHYIRARIIIIIHPRGRTPLTDHDSPPRDSIAIGGAADFARAIVISGRGCPIRRVTTRHGVPPTPAIDRADRSIDRGERDNTVRGWCPCLTGHDSWYYVQTVVSIGFSPPARIRAFAHSTTDDDATTTTTTRDGEEDGQGWDEHVSRRFGGHGHRSGDDENAGACDEWMDWRIAPSRPCRGRGRGWGRSRGMRRIGFDERLTRLFRRVCFSTGCRIGRRVVNCTGRGARRRRGRSRRGWRNTASGSGRRLSGTRSTRRRCRCDRTWI